MVVRANLKPDHLITVDLLLTGGRTMASEPASRVERGSWFVWLYRGLEGLRETKEGGLRGLRDDREAQRQRNRCRGREGEEGGVLKGREEKGKVISEGEEKRSLREREKWSLLILVALASYLYKLGNAKRKCEEM